MTKENQHYYEDGSLAAIEFLDGDNVIRRKLFRPRGETQRIHPFSDEMSSEITEIEFLYRPDGWFYAQYLRRADGTEVAIDNTPAPHRAPGIPPEAVFLLRPPRMTKTISAIGKARDEVQVQDQFESQSHLGFECGEWTFVDDAKIYRGIILQYNLDGTLELVSYSAPSPKDPEQYLTASLGNDGSKSKSSGNPLILAAQLGDSAAVEKFWQMGLWQSPQAAWHAALEGLPDLSRRILEAKATAPPSIQDQRSDRSRPDEVPTSSIWVPGLGAFVEGSLSSLGILEGLVHVWESPYGYTYVTKYEHEFVSGLLKRTLKPGKRESKETVYFTEGPLQGQIKLKRRYDQNKFLTEEIESHEDGSETRRVFYQGQSLLRAERREKDDQLVVENWFDHEGKRVGQVLRDETSADFELFKGSQNGSSVEVEGSTRIGMFGAPTGVFKIYETKKLIGEVDYDRIMTSSTNVQKKDLLSLTPKIFNWLKEVDQTKTLLTEAKAFPWASHSGWSSNGKNTYTHLVGLTMEDDEVFQFALRALWADSVDQETLSIRGGPILDIALDLLLKMEKPSHQLRLFEFIVSAWEEARIQFQEVLGLRGKPLQESYLASKPIFRELSSNGKTPEFQDLATKFLEIFEKENQPN